MTANTILITGCTRGIGRALALKFANFGYRVYAVGRDQALLNTLIFENSQIVPVAADLTFDSGRQTIVAALKNAGDISIIHNAGISEPKPFSSLPEETLRKHFEINFFAPLFLTQMLLPQLQNQRILSISTGAAVSAMSSHIAYCTSKGAFHHAIQCLNAELNQESIYFSNLRPGMVDTDMQIGLRNASDADLPPQRKAVYLRAKAENTLISPAVVAEFAAWVMTKTDNVTFSETFWDIYDATLYSQWLPSGFKIEASCS